MAQWVKVPDDLSSTPRAHIVERKNQLLQIVLRPPHMHYGMHLCTQTQTYINKCNF